MNAINNTNLPNSLLPTDFPKPISAKTKEKTQVLRVKANYGTKR